MWLESHSQSNRVRRVMFLCVGADTKRYVPAQQGPLPADTKKTVRPTNFETGLSWISRARRRRAAAARVDVSFDRFWRWLRMGGSDAGCGRLLSDLLPIQRRKMCYPRLLYAHTIDLLSRVLVESTHKICKPWPSASCQLVSV